MSQHLLVLGCQNENLLTAIFDSSAKTFKQVDTLALLEGTTWLTPHPKFKDLVYTNANKHHAIYLIRVSSEGTLEKVDEAQVEESMCHMALVADHSGLAIAHFGSSLVSFLPLGPEGKFLNHTPHPNHVWRPPHVALAFPRQDVPHPHQLVLYGKEFLMPDLGCNKVWRLNFKSTGDGSGWEILGEIGGFKLGDGPRHIAIHPDGGKHLYTLNECSSDVTIHSISPDPTKPSQLIGRYKMYPPSDDNKEHLAKMTSAELLLLPAENGRMTLLASNRGSPADIGDAVAIFSVSATDGADVKPAGFVWPKPPMQVLRGMGASLDGKYVCIGGNTTGGCAIFERKGDELKEVARMSTDGVVCPLWMN